MTCIISRNAVFRFKPIFEVDGRNIISRHSPGNFLITITDNKEVRAAGPLQYDIFSNLSEIIVRVNTWSLRILNHSHPVTLLDSTPHSFTRFQVLLDDTFPMFL